MSVYTNYWNNNNEHKGFIMALTDFGALSANQKVIWSTIVLMQGRDNNFWMNPSNGLMGKGLADATKPIHYVNELTKDERGTRCIMPLVLDLETSTIVGDNILEGNEEELISDTQEINVDQIRKAVKHKGKMAEQETVIQFRKTATDKLSFWKSEVIDELMFLTASGVSYTRRYDGSLRATLPNDQIPSLKFAAQVTAPSSDRVMYAGTATSTATLTVSYTMKWNLLLDMKAKLVANRIKPIRVQGKNTWMLAMSPYQARDLKKDADYQNAVRSGDERGKTKNALFTGAFVQVDGLALYEHNKLYNTQGLLSPNKWGSGGTVDGAQALALGAQALGYAEIGEPTWSESSNKDYDNRASVGYSCQIGIVKPVFLSRYSNGTKQDFGIMALYTAAKP